MVEFNREELVAMKAKYEEEFKQGVAKSSAINKDMEVL